MTRTLRALRWMPLCLLGGCEDPAPSISGTTTQTTADGPETSCADDSAIQAVPNDSPHRAYRNEGFDRMIQLTAPNGKTIRIYAQDEVTEAQMHKSLSLLRHFLSDAPGTTYGDNKTDVANQMATNGAVLMMPNGAHEEGNEPNLPAQPLYAAETAVIGHAWYLNNDEEHRDASWEEIFHLVHDMGIGTNQPGALPDYQAELLAGAEAALADGRWGGGEDQWISELRAEGSLAQEYIAAVIDSAMGLWAYAGQGMWGIYTPSTRAEVQDLDPGGWTLFTDFLSLTVAAEMRIDPSFEGTFSLQRDESEPYTAKSQYLENVTLTGTNDANLLGNDADNTLRGNSANNEIDGGEGYDTAVYCGASTNYTVEAVDGGWQVSGPDGTDTLRNIEAVWFTDLQQDLGAP